MTRKAKVNMRIMRRTAAARHLIFVPWTLCLAALSPDAAAQDAEQDAEQDTEPASDTEWEHTPDTGAAYAPDAGPTPDTGEDFDTGGAPDTESALESGSTSDDVDEPFGPAKPPNDEPSPAAPREAVPTEEEAERDIAARENGEPRKEVDLETVTVVGTNEFEELKESGYPITVIDPAKFAPRAMSVSDLLDRVPGVKVRRTGGLGSETRVSIRGLEGKRVQIYVDGSPLNTPDGSLGIDDIPLHIIERIEVYKGVVPAKFGGDGLGGAVNVVLIALPPRYLDFSYSAASYNQHRFHGIGKTYFEKPGIEWTVGLVGQLAENDYEMPLSDGGVFVRDHDRYRQLLAGTSLHFRKLYFDEFELQFVYINGAKEIQGIPGATGDTKAAIRNVRHARTWSHAGIISTHAEKEGFLAEKLDLVHDFTVPLLFSGLVDKSETVYDFEGNSYPSSSGAGEVGIGPNDSNDFRYDIRDRLNLNYRIIPQFSLNLNNQIQYTKNKPKDELADAVAGLPVSPRPGSLLTSVTGLSGELDIFDNRWLTVAGFKHYFFSSEGYETNLLYVSSEPIRNNNHGFGANVATRFKIVEYFLIKASYEHGQRMPTADEIFGNGLNIMTSPDLKPEKSDNVIAGFYLDKAFGQNRNVIVKLESDAFLMYVDDMIRLGGIMEKSYQNEDKAKIWGVDGEIQVELSRHFYTYFNYTYQDIRNDAQYLSGTSQANHLKGMRMPNIPPYFFNWGAELTFFDVFGKWAAPTEFVLFYDGSRVAEFLYGYEVTRNKRYRVPAVTTHDVGFMLAFQDKRYSLSASVINITDEQRYDLYSQPLPGRVFKLALRGTFY